MSIGFLSSVISQQKNVLRGRDKQQNAVFCLLYSFLHSEMEGVTCSETVLYKNGGRAGLIICQKVRLLVIISFFLLSCFASYAQSVGSPHSVLSSGGDIVTVDGATISYSIGQSSYKHFGSDLMLHEGVQQAFCIPFFDTVRYEICQGVGDTFLSLLPAGYVLPPSVRLDEPGEYDFVIRLLTDGGCDSIIWGMLTVHPNRDTNLYVQTSECYNWFGRDYSASGVYSNHIATSHGCDSLLTLNLTLIKGQPLPEIWVFNNEVLFVSHIQGSYLDIRYADYRWYRDGVLVRQDTAADRYFNPDGTALSGCYYLEVPTSEAKTEWVRSNTICIGSVGIGNVAADDLSLTLYPNPAATHSVVHVSLSLTETQLQGAKIKVFDVQGRQVLERAAHKQIDFVCDFAAGVYSVHVVLPGGRHVARKLVVR